MSARQIRILVAAFTWCAAVPGVVEAAITRLEIDKVEAAFHDWRFEPVGVYERLTGRAHGEVDPRDPKNAIIQDIALAPRNARGMVEYTTDIDILRPREAACGNGLLLVEVHNRGNKLALRNFHLNVPAPAQNAVSDAGDGHLLKAGYTIVWFGWQADLLPGNDRLLFKVPIAKNPDGSPLTGVVRSELTTVAPVTTLNLSSGWFTGLTHASYPTVGTDNRKPLADGFLPSLTVRAKESAPRVIIPNTEWNFGACPQGALTPNDTQICLPAGFQPGRLYELLYRAKEPLVLGLGFAALRDVGAFFKNESADATGTANPVFRAGTKAIVVGSSQSGRMIRSYLHLGFNQDEKNRIVFEGAMPHIGGGLMPMNIRFGPVGRAWGEQVDRLYPAYDFPFAYGRQYDPISGRTQGILDRCTASGTCPRIFHVATALEVWEGRQSLGLTDPLGWRDVPDPDNVRTFIMASTQHAVPALPLPQTAPFNNCVQQANPNPQVWAMRALLAELAAWVQRDVNPPTSAVPKIADGSLVAPSRVQFPAIPANNYGGVARTAVRFTGMHNPLHPLDHGPEYNAADSSGITTYEPPRVGTASYGVLVPQVDADGNDVAGLRSPQVQVPIGTYTSWNLGRAERFEDGFCNFQGTFVPFAPTRVERVANGDPRRSIEERYPTKDAYVAAMRAATENLVKQRYLLREDADLLVREAEGKGIRAAP